MSQNVDVNKTLNEGLPDNFNDVELGGHKGLLSPLGDPLGKALGKGLSPVGNVIGGTGDRMGKFTNQGSQNEKGEEYKKFGGKDQTAENPLGL